MIGGGDPNKHAKHEQLDTIARPQVERRLPREACRVEPFVSYAFAKNLCESSSFMTREFANTASYVHLVSEQPFCKPLEVAVHTRMRADLSPSRTAPRRAVDRLFINTSFVITANYNGSSRRFKSSSPSKAGPLVSDWLFIVVLAQSAFGFDCCVMSADDGSGAFSRSDRCCGYVSSWRNSYISISIYRFFSVVCWAYRFFVFNYFYREVILL